MLLLVRVLLRGQIASNNRNNRETTGNGVAQVEIHWRHLWVFNNVNDNCSVTEIVFFVLLPVYDIFDLLFTKWWSVLLPLVLKPRD